MASNNNNNELREELTQLQNKVTRISNNTKDAIISLKCEVWKCNGNEPILIDGKLPNPSRIGQLENKLKELEEMWNEDSDDDSDDSDDSDDEMIGQLENRLKELEEGLEEVRKWSTDIETNKTRSNGNRNRIANLESWRQSLGDGGFVPPDGGPGAGGGKRRKRTRGKLQARSRVKSRKKRRRKRGGTRKNAGPEKPIVGYYYRINIYWPIGGTGPFTEIRYENVIGKYMGLASEIFDGWADDERIPIPPYVFKTNSSDCEEGCIGEIISKIGPSTTYINGGRRKKRTKKRRKSRRKSKGRKRGRKNLKKRTKRRR